MSELSVSPSVQTEAPFPSSVVMNDIRITEATAIEPDPAARISMYQVVQRLAWLVDDANRMARHLRPEDRDATRYAEVMRNLAAAHALAQLLVSAF